jgi:hypothetical protein
MNLGAKIGRMDLLKISESLIGEALGRLECIIQENINEDDFKMFSQKEKISYRNKLSIVIDGYPGYPAFEANVSIWCDLKKIGCYTYIARIDDLVFIDEFFVIY